MPPSLHDHDSAIRHEVIAAIYSIDKRQFSQLSSKTVQINALIESLDSSYGLSARINRDSLFNTEFEPETVLENLKKVTKEGVSKVAAQLKKDTIYLLRDDKDE